MFLRRCAYLCLWLVLGLYLLRPPATAADTVKTLLSGLSALADALARFASAF